MASETLAPIVVKEAYPGLDAQSDEEILELTYVTATYMMHAVMSRALRLEYDDVDDPVTEVPAPEGATADVMGMVDRRKRD